MTQKNRKKSDKELRVLQVKSNFNQIEILRLDDLRGEINRGRFLRESALQNLPPVRFDNALILELAKIGSNLNQIARNVNTKKSVDLQTLSQLKQIENLFESSLESIEEKVKSLELKK